MKTLVLGLGNPILTDDGVGVWVAEEVRKSLPPSHAVDVSEASIGGLTLMERMLGYDRVVLIDALQPGHGDPGTFQRLTLEDLKRMSPTQHSASTHNTTLVTAIEMGQRMGLPLPEDVVIFAVSIENAVDFCDQLTPPVANVVPDVVSAVLKELDLGSPVGHQPAL